MQFLKYVADDLRKKYRNDLSRVAVVFPNKRAGIFFDDYLMSQHGTENRWFPRYYCPPVSSETFFKAPVVE